MSGDLKSIRVLGQIISRLGLAKHLGMSFGGDRDYYKIFGWKRTLHYNDLFAMYVRGGIAKRIVDAPARALWDNPPLITTGNAEWDGIWNDLVTKKGLWKAVLQADKLAGIGRFSCLFIGVSGGQNPQSAPRVTENLRDLLYIQPYSQNTTTIDRLVQDPRDPRYGLPQLYSFEPSKTFDDGVGQGISATQSFKAHAGRVIHIAENTLENDIYGSPRLEASFNDLTDLMKVSGGTAETFWLTANRGMQLDVDPEMELDPDDAKDLSDEVEEYQHGLRRFIRTRGVKVNNLGSDVPESDQAYNMLISNISGTQSMPRRILIGAEAGQLASEQDRANWAESVEQRRNEFAEPVVIFPLIEQLTNLGVLPQLGNTPINITWPDAFILNPLERSQKAAQEARSATNFARAVDIWESMRRGTPGIDPQLDEEGNPIPGTGQEAVPGADLPELITATEIRQRMELDLPSEQLTNPGDQDTE